MKIKISSITCMCVVVHFFAVFPMSFLTMGGRGACCKAPPQEQAWLQSHIGSLVLPHPRSGQYREGLCAGNLQRQRRQGVEPGSVLSCTYTHSPTEGAIPLTKAILPLPQVAVHSVKAPLLHTNGDRVSRGRSVRGGMRAFLLGAEPLVRDLSGVHRSEVGGENTEEEDEDEEKGGTTAGGAAGGRSSTDKVKGPKRDGENR